MENTIEFNNFKYEEKSNKNKEYKKEKNIKEISSIFICV